jgi:aspartate/methionine/tyrosine aminotransferase
MARFIDGVPLSGIIRIRDLMYSIDNPFRLDQGDVSFEAPDTLKAAMVRAIAENKSHYLQTNGLPRLRELLADKLRRQNKIPADPEHVLVTNGGIHGLYVACQALLEPADDVSIPDPAWPPVVGNLLLAKAVANPCPLHENLRWRYDLDQLERSITRKTRAIYINSPHNPTGGVLSRADIERIAALAKGRDLWVISDEAYEDVVFEGEHISIASLPGMYQRTIPLYTFSKTYAITGLRLGYVAIENEAMRERAKKVLFHTASNVSSVVQFGGIGALEGSQACVAGFREELLARRDLFYSGIDAIQGGILSGTPPAGAFYAFLKIDPSWKPSGSEPSVSWALTEYLIQGARIGSVPGIDFGAAGEGYLRLCFARDRSELTGALESMQKLLRRGP